MRKINLATFRLAPLFFWQLSVQDASMNVVDLNSDYHPESTEMLTLPEMPDVVNS